MRLPPLILGSVLVAGVLTTPVASATSLRAGPGQELIVRSTMTDPDGTSYVRMDRTYRGLPVLGGDVVVRRGPGGEILGATDALAAPLALSTTPRVAAANAGRIAANSAGHLTGRQVGKPSLVIEVLGDNAAARVPTLAWEVPVNGSHPDGLPSKLHVLVDADNGSVTARYDDVQAGTGHGLHNGDFPLTTMVSESTPSLRVMRDPSRNNIITYDMRTQYAFTSDDDDWGNGRTTNAETAGVDVQWGTAATFDFYRDVFGHELLDNRGDPGYRELTGHVHESSAKGNAYWDATCDCMTFGDATAATYDYTALDVVAHEATHSVVYREAGLRYWGESGGLNEATADIVGNLVEFHAANPKDQPDFLVGEKVWKSAPLRWMDQPSRDGKSADCWYDGVGDLNVHRSSGVGNHAFFLLANGSGTSAWGTSPTCDGSVVAGIGRDTAAQVWFRALTRHWTSTTNYQEARAGLLAAASDLYGACGVEYRAVQAAWSAVSVTGTDQPCG